MASAVPSRSAHDRRCCGLTGRSAHQMETRKRGGGSGGESARACRMPSWGIDQATKYNASALTAVGAGMRVGAVAQRITHPAILPHLSMSGSGHGLFEGGHTQSSIAAIAEGAGVASADGEATPPSPTAKATMKIANLRIPLRYRPAQSPRNQRFGQQSGIASTPVL